VGIVFAALFTVWWVKKPDWSRHHTGAEPRPRSHYSPAPAVPPRALWEAEHGTTFRPDIEGLRSIAVLLVLGYHAVFPGFRGGLIGVDVFFVLSGYLITSLLLRELGTTGTVSLSNFWARRARRLLPASGLVLIVTLLASRWLIDGISQGNLGRDAIAGCLFVANIRFWKVGTDYLAEGVPPSPLLHFWSLAVEEQFYMVWPGLLLILVRFMKLRRAALAGLMGVLWVVSFAICVKLTYDGSTQQTWAFFMLPARTWELMTGALLALLGPTLVRFSRQVAGVIGTVGIAVVIAVAVVYKTTPLFPGYLVALPVIATAAVILAGSVPGAGGAMLLLRAKPLQWIGARSYSIYLWHFPLLIMAGRKWSDTGLVADLPVATRAGLLVLAVVLAAVTYQFVENPVRHSRELSKFPVRSLVMGAWIALLGVGAATLLIHNPPKLSAGGEVAAPTLVTTATTAAPTVDTSLAIGTTVPGETTTSAGTTTTTQAPQQTADASHDNPAALADLIAANLPALQDAVNTSKVPGNLSPSLAHAPKDLPPIYSNGCILDVGDNNPKQCIYGDPNGSVKIVLFGDSHAAEWMPALNKIGAANGWKLIVHVKKACPDADIPTDKDPNRTDCAKWRSRVIDLMSQMQPDLVIMSSYRYKQVGAAAGRDPDTVWKEGIDKTVALVRPLTKHLLLLGDSATPKEDIPTCLAGHLSSVSSCMQSRDGAVRPGRLAVEREIAAKYDADFIPTSDWMCTDTACPVIIGNVMMYRDNSHITASASVFLAPYVEAAVKSVLA